MTDAEKLARLPKWAQTEINVLRSRVEDLRNALSEGTEGSNVFLDPYADPPRPLGNNQTIGFGTWESGQFIVEYDGRKLRVATHGDGWKVLAVVPHSGNVVELIHQDSR